MKNLFRNNLQLFLLADLICQFGAGITLGTLNWLVLDHMGKNELVSYVFGVNVVCGLLISFFSGLIVDRFDKKAVVIWSNVFRIALTLITLLLFLFTGFHYSYVFLLAISNGIGWNIYFPATKALLQSITAKGGNVLKGNSGAEIAMQVGMFSAGAVGGLLYKNLGFNTILIINIVMFVIASLLVKLISVETTPAKTGLKLAHLKEDFIDGFKYFRHRSAIFLLGITMFIPFVAAGLINVSLPGYVSTFLNEDSVTFGLITMCYGIGACISGLIIMNLSSKISRKGLVLAGFIIAILCGGLMFVNHSVAIACFNNMMFGFCGSGIRIIMYSEVMEKLPSEYIGRAMSIWNVIGMALQIGCTYIVGKSMDAWGAQYGFLILSSVMMLGFIIYGLSYRMGKKSSSSSTMAG
ncbi:Predicted arabinose efflux permease, MFS family [Thermoactinomyces sp. DSM 45891]|nr:Predicted arabinose efflux permease, MFS family [Thermoactinomyces sp. DSM 45891]